MEVYELKQDFPGRKSLGSRLKGSELKAISMER